MKDVATPTFSAGTRCCDVTVVAVIVIPKPTPPIAVIRKNHGKAVLTGNHAKQMLVTRMKAKLRYKIRRGAHFANNRPVTNDPTIHINELGVTANPAKEAGTPSIP